MTEKNVYLKQQAEEARALYRSGAISREEAIERIKPYQKAFNDLSAEKAKKFGVKPMKFSIMAYLR